jgi:photosystem II stability/assembly factor-like uncharacterized protein
MALSEAMRISFGSTPITMKRPLSTLAFTLLAFYSFAQWTLIPSGTTARLQDVHFPSDSIGYAVGGEGSHGKMVKTTDGGDTWAVSLVDSFNTLFAVHFINNTTGFAAGSKLLKTTDGGATWNDVFTDTTGQILSVYFVNDSLGFVGGTYLYRTTDAGTTWTSTQLNNIFSAIHFPSDSVGYFVGGTSISDPLWMTTDAGLTFSSVTNGFQSIKEGTHYLNDSVGYICGWYGGLLRKTTDRGQTWGMLGDSLADNQCFDIHFRNENTGYYIENGGGRYRIQATTDGGLTWTIQLENNSNAWLESFWFIDDHRAFVVGDSGKIYKTDNGGGLLAAEDRMEDEWVRVFPNPANDQITVSHDGASPCSIAVYSMMGQEMMGQSNLQDGQQLDLRGLANGIYLMNITNLRGEQATLRIVKQ